MARTKRYPGVIKLPNGRYRAVISEPETGKTLSVATVLGQKGTTWGTPQEAFAAREQAYKLLHAPVIEGVKLAQWWQMWTTDPNWQRPKESTNIHNCERTKRFVERYGDMPLPTFDTPGPGGRGTLGDQVVSEWLAGGRNRSTVMALRAMFNDARSKTAGRLLMHNPFTDLGVERTRGRKDVAPPSMELAEKMIEAATELTCVSFAMWLKFAMFTGMRPAEVDALRWSDIDFDREAIRVERQFNTKTRTFTLPKNGQARNAILTPQAREALVTVAQDGPAGEFCFVGLRGTHWTASSRSYHWNAVRAATGWTGRQQDLYLATRHFAGKYLYNDRQFSAEDVAAALGHTDRGALVRSTYGHFDDEQALDRVREGLRIP